MATAASRERITKHVARLLRAERDRSPFESVRAKAVSAAAAAGLSLPEQGGKRPETSSKRTA
jgi:hypothetical protein